jgi:hypothetical protein
MRLFLVAATVLALVGASAAGARPAPGGDPVGHVTGSAAAAPTSASTVAARRKRRTLTIDPISAEL